MAKWNGEYPTIDLTDDELLEARRQQLAVSKLIRHVKSTDESKAARNARDRRRCSYKKAVKCNVCAIRTTCEKRKKLGLKQCTYGFVESAE